MALDFEPQPLLALAVMALDFEPQPLFALAV
jgi:hypothetical protein